MKKNILLVLGLICSTALSAQEVSIPSTQRLTLNSAIVGQEYELLIHLPGNYDKQTNLSYPVMYLLDAQWDFPLTTGLYGSQYYDGFLPGIIIVGITWGGKDPNPGMLRFRDFTPPVANQQTGTGNAENFLAFIKKELIPFIDSKFRTKKDDRVLSGSSLGGLFTLYSLFTEPSLFNRYVLTSPALRYGDGTVLKLERSYAGKKLPLKAKLYMAHGELEHPEAFLQFVDTLKKRHYAGLEMQTRIIDHIGHSGTKAEGYARGLQWVFAKPSLKLPESVLNNYVGSYEMSGITLKLVAEDGQLVAVVYNSKTKMKAETETDFYYEGQFLRMHFKKDASGKVSGFEWEEFDSSQFIKKINN